MAEQVEVHFYKDAEGIVYCASNEGISYLPAMLSPVHLGSKMVEVPKRKVRKTLERWEIVDKQGRQYGTLRDKPRQSDYTGMITVHLTGEYEVEE